MKTVNGLEPAKKISYLPHMAVVHKDAETTKVRVLSNYEGNYEGKRVAALETL